MTECTVHQAAEDFIGHLRESGKKERTIYTYRKELEVVEAFFGADRQLAESASQVGKFCKSDLLLKLPDGKERPSAPSPRPSVFRMMMVWARESGRIEELPLPRARPWATAG